MAISESSQELASHYGTAMSSLVVGIISVSVWKGRISGGRKGLCEEYSSEKSSHPKIVFMCSPPSRRLH